jgi:hypothetical protein
MTRVFNAIKSLAYSAVHTLGTATQFIGGGAATVVRKLRGLGFNMGFWH